MQLPSQYILQLFLLRSSLLDLNSVNFDLPILQVFHFLSISMHIYECREEVSFMSGTDNESCIQFMFASVGVVFLLLKETYSSQPFTSQKEKRDL